jgi:hypothetical protein
MATGSRLGNRLGNVLECGGDGEQMTNGKRFQVTLYNATVKVEIDGVKKRKTAIRRAIAKLQLRGLIGYDLDEIEVREIKDERDQ